MIEKRILIVNGMTGQEHQVRVAEGARPPDILSQLGLTNHQLARVRDRQVLNPTADVTREVQDGDRLFAFAPMIVGGAA